MSEFKLWELTLENIPCVQGDASTFALTEFMFVDFKAKFVKVRTGIATRSSITNQ